MLSDYNLDNYAFEVRYANAYRLWDNAGKIGEILAQRFKDVKLNKGEPALISFSLNRTVTVEVRLERLNIIHHNPPSNYSRETDDLEWLFEGLIEILNVKEITRLGTRLLFKKLFNDKAGMERYFRKYLNSKAVDLKLFNVNPEYIMPTLNIQVEDEELGYHFRFLGKVEHLNFDLGPAVKDIDPIDQDKCYAAIDIDIYTMKVLEMRSVKVASWMDTVTRVIRRDTDKVLTNLEV